ncbi:MAG: LpqB family beta-propeller domain-containing protein [Chloroflexi bacterium]|nr:LpqB family beta-propeller domain-containing protein [Chloroflexota bacterium]
MKAKSWTIVACFLVLIVAACSSIDDESEVARPADSAAPTAGARLSNSFNVGGRILFVKGNALWLWQNGNAKQLTNESAYENPAWSPDGKRVAAIKRAGNYSDLVVLNLNGKMDQQLTRFGPTPRPQDSTWARMPSWSPDGSKIAFSADAGTLHFGLWTVDTGGSKLIKPSYRALGEGDADSPAWSPDGKNLAFAAYWDTQTQIYALALSTGAVKKLTNHQEGAYDPSWSPDGAKIGYVARSDNKNDVWVMDADGSNPTQVTTSGAARSPRWSPDGQYMAFVANQSQSFDLYAIKISGHAGAASASSEIKQLTKGQSIEAAGGISWAK